MGLDGEPDVPPHRSHHRSRDRRFRQRLGPISQDPVISYVHRHAPEVFLFLYLAIILYCTWVPFRSADGRLIAWPETSTTEWKSLSGLITQTPGLKDILPNILLYVPLGTGFYVVARRRRWRRYASIGISFLVGITISLVAEWSQQYAPLRVPSWVDVVCNVLGAMVGAALGRIGRRQLYHLLRSIRVELRTMPLSTATRSYMVLLLVVGMIPLDVAFDRSRLGQAVKQARVVPFGQLITWSHEHQEARNRGDTKTSASIERAETDYACDLAAEAAAFGLLGGLMVLRFHREQQLGRLVAMLAAAFFTARWAVVISGLQFFILSRGFDTTDILVRSLAGAIASMGVALRSARPVLGDVGHLDPLAPNLLPSVTRTAKVMLPLIVIYIFCRGFAPLTLFPNSLLLQGNGRTLELIPLAGYFEPRIATALDDVLHKVLRYAVFGVCVAMAGGLGLARDSQLFHRRAIRIGFWGAGISAIIELCQFYIPTRFPDLTHTLLAGAGACGGAIAARWAYDYYRVVRQYPPWPPHQAQTISNAAQGSVIFNVMIPPPDASAPRENVPPRHKKGST